MNIELLGALLTLLFEKMLLCFLKRRFTLEGSFNIRYCFVRYSIFFRSTL